MNEMAKGNTMYERIPVVAELNKVAGFDPIKFTRKVVEGGAEKLLLDLKYKKLWFRLRYPQGRLKVSPLKITEQLAIIEAKVYFDKKDTVPAASFIAQRYAKDTPGGLYIESAQYMAADTALGDAGFGVQLISAGENQPVQNKVPMQEKLAPLPLAPAPAVAVAAPPIAAQTIAPVTQGQRLTQEAPPPAVPAEETTVTQTAPPPAVEAPVTQKSSSVMLEQEVAPATAPAVEQTPVAETLPRMETAAPEQAPTEQLLAEAETPQAPPTLEVAAAEPTWEVTPHAEPDANTGEVRYTADMPVDEICSLMTLDEARDIIVDIGTCKGQTLAWVSERRAASLKWYLNGYEGDNNMLRAGAKLLLESLALDKAS